MLAICIILVFFISLSNSFFPSQSGSLFPFFPSCLLCPSFTPCLFFLLHLPMFPLYLSLRSLQMLCLVRSHKEIIYSCPPVLVCISMPAEHVNLSLGYRRWVVKLSSDSLQQDDHRMPVARRIRAVVMISNGGPVLLHCNSLNCTNCMTQWYAKKDYQPKIGWWRKWKDY